MKKNIEMIGTTINNWAVNTKIDNGKSEPDLFATIKGYLDDYLKDGQSENESEQKQESKSSDTK